MIIFKRLIRFRNVDWERLADNTALIGMLWGIFVLVPSWFDPLRGFNGIAMAGFAVLMALQVIFLRYAMRKD